MCRKNLTWVHSKLLACIGVLLLGQCFAAHSFADSSDHIGPDPIQSENCVALTPGRSVVCSGYLLAKPQDVHRPMVTINCGPGIFMLINHRPMPVESAWRRIRLISDDGEWSRQWLAISPNQSGFLVFDGGSEAADYRWMLRLMGRLVTPGESLFGFSFNEQELEGVFEFGYSDRYLIEQLVSNC